MRWMVSRGAPKVTRLLVVESGPREVLEQLIPRLREVFGPETPIDLLTCLPPGSAGLPAGMEGHGWRVWNVTDCADNRSRWRLLRELRSQRYPAAAVLCAGSPLMSAWRTAALLMLPSKFLIVNENADFFWLDRGHWRNLTQLWLHHSGVFEESAVRAAARLAAFPFTLAFLLVYAAYVHGIRAARLLLGLRSSSTSP